MEKKSQYSINGSNMFSHSDEKKLYWGGRNIRKRVAYATLGLALLGGCYMMSKINEDKALRDGELERIIITYPQKKDNN